MHYYSGVVTIVKVIDILWKETRKKKSFKKGNIGKVRPLNKAVIVVLFTDTPYCRPRTSFGFKNVNW